MDELRGGVFFPCQKPKKKHSLLFLTCEALPGRRRPLVLPVRQVPLVSQRDDAGVARARHHCALRLRVNDAVAGGDQRGLELRFRVGDLFSGELADEHHALGESFQVDGGFRVGELLGVVLRGDAELLAGPFGGEGP